MVLFREPQAAHRRLSLEGSWDEQVGHPTVDAGQLPNHLIDDRIRSQEERMGKSSTRRVVQGLLAGALVLAMAGCAGLTPDQLPQVGGSQGYMDTISVSGYGEATGAPDLGSIQVGFSISNSSISAAISESNVTVEAITDAVVALGVDPVDVQTSNFSVWPEERYDPATGLPTGEKTYRVENTIGIKVRELDLMPKVIEAALSSGANNLYGLNFSIDDDAELAAQARVNAVADARLRAEQLAQELGVSLGPARIASEVYGGGGIYFPEAAMGLGGGGGPPISEGQLTVGVTVVVTFDIER
jgi:uncharacterized protein